MSTNPDTPLTLGSAGQVVPDTSQTQSNTGDYYYALLSEEYLISQQPKPNSGSRNYLGSLDFYLETLDPGMPFNTIGTYINTNFGQPVGSHEGHNGTTITTESISYPIKQSTDTSTSSKPRLDYPDNSIRLCYQDGTGDIREMDSDGIVAFGKRLLTDSLDNEYAGSFRLSLSNPGNGTWEKWNSNTYDDVTAGGTTEYTLWRKTANSTTDTAGKTAPPKGLLTIDNSAATVALRELSESEQLIAITQCVRHARKYSDIGKYLLLRNSETPNGEGETGDWAERGTINDTRNRTETIQYSGPLVDGNTRTENYSATYSGTYDRVDQEETFVQYDGVRQISYDGSRNSYQQGSNLFWAGSRQTDVDNPSTIQYAGTFTGQRDHDELTPTTLLGEDSYIVQKQFTRYYTSQRYFQGGYIVYKQVWFIDFFTGSYTMSNPNSNQRSWYKPGGPIGGSYFGTYQLPATHFLGTSKYTTMTSNYVSNRLGPMGFARFVNYASPRYFERQYQGSFTNYLTTYGVIQVYRQFTGDRNFVGQRGHPEFFSGQRTFSDNYIGERYFDGNYVGPTSVQRSSTIQVPYNGSYTGDYIGYSSASFTQQFGANYDGNTITNPTELIDSYTLWVKKSE